MKKSFLALAVLSAFAGSAFAEPTVTAYGVVDAGVVSESGASSSTTKLTSGVQSGSRLGFRGTEYMGTSRDLKVDFTLESGINIDAGTSAQGGVLLGRQAHIDLSTAALGTLSAGRQYTSLFNTLYTVADPFQTGLAGTSLNFFSAGGIRLNNSVKYASPDVHGFTGDLMYGFGEVAGDAAASRTLAGSVGYANGPVAVRLAYQDTNDVTATDSAKTTLLAGSYDFGVVKANAAYAINKGVGTLDSHDLLLGASVPFGASKVLVSYMKKDDRSGLSNDASQLAVGYTYDLSKRTNVYTSYAKITNKNGAAYTVGNAGGTGTGDSAFNVGLRHSF